MTPTQNILSSQIDQARSQGISDSDIVSYLASQRPDLAPQISQAQSQGISSGDIVSYLKTASVPSAQSVPGMEKLGGVPPAAGMPPVYAGHPGNLTESGESQTVNDAVNAPTIPFVGGPMALAQRALGFSAQGAKTAVGGVEQMAQPGMRNKATGAHKVLAGAGQAVAPFVLPAAAATAPVATAAGLAGGYLASKGAQAGLQAAGVPEEYSQLGGDIAGIAAGGEAARYAPAAVNALATGATEATRTNPITAMVQALKPKPSDSGFVDRLPETMADIKANAPNGVTDVDSLVGASNSAIASHQDVLENQWMAPARQMGVQVPGDSIVQATAQAIPKSLKLEDPGAALDIVQSANDAYGGKNFSVDDMRELLKNKNAELDSFYDKSTGKQNAAIVSGKPIAVVKAQKDAIADALYKALDPQNDGAGPREIQSRTGDIMDIRDAALGRKNAAIAEKPLSMAAGYGKTAARIADLPGKIVHGDIEGGMAAIPQAIRGTTDPLIKRAFANIGPPKPLPAPNAASPVAVGRQLPPSSFSSNAERQMPGNVPNPVRVTTGVPLQVPPSRQLAPAEGPNVGPLQRGVITQVSPPPILTPPPPDASAATITTGEPLSYSGPRQLVAPKSIAKALGQAIANAADDAVLAATPSARKHQ